MVKLRTGGSLETVKSFPNARWAWLVLVGQGSRADFSCGQGVKRSGTKICWVKILTPVAGESTVAYVVSPPWLWILYAYQQEFSIHSRYRLPTNNVSQNIKLYTRWLYIQQCVTHCMTLSIIPYHACIAQGLLGSDLRLDTWQ